MQQRFQLPFAAVAAMLTACGACSDGANDANTDTDVGQSEACAIYVDCLGGTDPASVAEALTTYGPDGSCWESEGSANSCNDACVNALTQAYVETAAPACELPDSAIGKTLALGGSDFDFAFGDVHMNSLNDGQGDKPYFGLTTWRRTCAESEMLDEPEDGPYAEIRFRGDAESRFFGITVTKPGGDRNYFDPNFKLIQLNDWDANPSPDNFKGILVLWSDDVKGALKFSAKFCQ